MREKRYTISEASKLLEVENHVLRYWEDELELKIRRNDMGHRYYTEEDIRTLNCIKELKNKGFQLRAVKEVLPDLAQKGMIDLHKLLATQVKLEQNDYEAEHRPQLIDFEADDEGEERASAEEDIRKEDTVSLIGIEDSMAQEERIEEKALEEKTIRDTEEKWVREKNLTDNRESMLEKKVLEVDTAGETKKEEEERNQAGGSCSEVEAKERSIVGVDCQTEAGQGNASGVDYQKPADPSRKVRSQKEVQAALERSRQLSQERERIRQTRKKKKTEQRAERNVAVNENWSSVVSVDSGQCLDEEVAYGMRQEKASSRKVIAMHGAEETKEISELSPSVSVVQEQSRENRMAQFEAIMEKIIGNALCDQLEIFGEMIGDQISDKVVHGVDELMVEQEKREEARFRKLDETIREHQKLRQGGTTWFGDEEGRGRKKKSRFYKKHGRKL